MEELWVPPSPEAAEMIRAICEQLLDEAESLAGSISSAAFAALNDPGLISDPSLQQETSEFNRSDLVQWLTANVQQPGLRVEPYVGHRIATYLDDVSNRGLEPNYASGWQAALGVAWRRWITACIEYGATSTTLAEVLDCSAHSLVQYALDSVTKLREARLEAASEHVGEQAVEMIQLVASGAPVTKHMVEERLGYRISREHCALILWIDDPKFDRDLDKAVAALRTTAHGSPLLIARSSATSRWMWFSGPTRPDEQLLCQTLAKFPTVRASVGRPGEGLNGFRMSHQEALAAQALITRLSAMRKFTKYSDVELIDNLTKDRKSAHRFVLNTLGKLSRADETLREALLTYIQCGFTTTRAANKLFLHRNTVERRVARANELISTKVEDNPAHVAAALLVLDLVPDIALLPE